jgi:hypothetical protein
MKNKIIINKYDEKYHHILNNLHNQILNLIPEENINTKAYHEWMYNLSDSLNENIDIIRNSPELKNELTENNKYKMIPVKNMDEIYYSVPPKNQENMYGDTGLYAKHIDGINLYDNCILYRILISLTPKQEIYTIFTEKNIVVELDKFEYLGFDFNEEQHQVSGHLKEGNNRILLKLHYLVYKNKSKKELKIINDYFVEYEHFTRKVMSYGSTPKNLMEYFIGNISNYGTFLRLKIKYIPIVVIYSCICFILGKKIKNLYSIQNFNCDSKENN